MKRLMANAGSDNPDAANALRAKLFKVLVGDATPPNAFFSFAPGGLPQSDFTLRFLTKPQFTDQAFAFAHLANSVPLGVGDWVASATPMWDIYKDWLDRYVPPPFSLTPEEEKRLRAAEAFIIDKTNADNYWLYRLEYNNAYSAWFTLKVMPEDDRPSNYPTLLSTAKSAMDSAKMKWDILGKRATYESDYAIVQDLSQRDPTRTKQSLRDKLGSPSTSPLGDYYDTLIYPANLLDPAVKWAQFSMFHNEIHDYSQEDSYRWGGSASAGALLWSAGAEHEGRKEYKKYSTDISNMKIEFELLRAPIIRNWFSSFLLTGRGWRWPTSTKDDPSGGDPFSDGNVPPKQGNWPMIPTEAVFARNLKVKLDMSSKVNEESLLATKSSFEAGWGLFKIKGNVETSEGTKQFDFVESGDGITCDQPQIVGFFCQLMPAEPNPNWALWEQAAQLANAVAMV